MFESVPSPLNRNKEALNVKTGKELGWKNSYNEAQLYLFRKDFDATIEKAGFAVRDWVEGDLKGYGKAKPEKIATLSCEDTSKIVIAYYAREPNNSNVQIYFIENGNASPEGGNHDMSASEFLDNLKYSLACHSQLLPPHFDSSEEVARMKNWLEYEKMDL